MSVSEKVSAIKDLLSFVVNLVPRVFDVVSELIVLIKDVRGANG